MSDSQQFVDEEFDAVVVQRMSEAAQYEVIDAYRLKNLNVQTLKFLIPLDHEDPAGSEKITVVARLVTKFTQNGRPSSAPKWTLDIDPANSNILVYLQGGPGFPCPPPDYADITKEFIDRGYQILYLDQRGTGMSTQIDATKLLEFGTDKQRIKYLNYFRALDIVNDAEHIRKILIPKDTWSLHGQSYGGFCATTYLSYYPEGLRQVLMTGGIPPINLKPDDVYHATYLRTEDRNVAYYNKYPGDIVKLHEICEYLSKGRVKLPNGGYLSIERLQVFGISFGQTSGSDRIHQLVFKLHYDLKIHGRFTFGTLQDVQNTLSFDTNIIYFLFQEAIYLDTGMKSQWAADKIRYESKLNYNYPLLSEKIKSHSLDKSALENAVYFTGEMIYKSMTDDFVELIPLKSFAYALHENTDWGTKTLYRPEVLQQNKVPVAAASYYHDQYVDLGLQVGAGKYIKGLRQYITTDFFHNGAKEDPPRVLGTLLGYLENGETI